MTPRGRLIATAAAIGTVCGAILSVGKVAGVVVAYFDNRYAARPAFERFAHDDTLRHQFAERQRARTNYVIDSIERAHQRPGRGRVLQQAGDPRDPNTDAKR